MKQSLGANPCIYPQPVLIVATFNTDGTANAMNAAWGGVCDYKKISLILDKGHKTVKNLLERKAFTVSIADVPHVVQADYLGLVSGNTESDKLKKAGLTWTKSGTVDAPVIAEFPLTLECTLESYDESTERATAAVVNTLADSAILTEGKIDLQKFRPLTFDPVNHDYVALGGKAGKAFHDGKALMQ